ncbi:MAG TPA: winged helix-turn-helix domain-containing protein [Myxococcales bacterium]|jgi:DNA-binding winged helix-turn-helix (wHTH) protein|nr:winged helix-turn-helix domain-containing protein [Myxococcales bacterium]
MDGPRGAPRTLRFGVFDLDFRAGELRKRGVKFKVQEQPFQVLTALLERPGDLLTREELKQKLWPGTTVDFDHSLNTTINKLREALGDSAGAPRFIETLPRRGYRFIYPVNAAPGDEPVGSRSRPLAPAPQHTARDIDVELDLNAFLEGGELHCGDRVRITLTLVPLPADRGARRFRSTTQPSHRGARRNRARRRR